MFAYFKKLFDDLKDHCVNCIIFKNVKETCMFRKSFGIWFAVSMINFLGPVVRDAFIYRIY